VKPEPLRLSQQQEKRIAKRVGGTLNAGSGNQWKRKADVREREVLWEMKRTNAKSITIRLADLETVRKEAALIGRLPVLHIELGTRRYVIIEEDDYFDGTHNGIRP
jgi:hypothetical protein